jgi:hypothetical protein
LAVCLLSSLSAAEVEVRREIAFPSLPGYQTLVCDFHIHTVFSDGEVWPSWRAVEAWRQGLHVMAITDHIESDSHPHKPDLAVNHERPYELAKDSAGIFDVLLIKGAEISRSVPPGHFNALFIREVKPLDTKDFLEAVERANEQGGFVIWNHPGWLGGTWTKTHTILYEKRWLHGIEVCSGTNYYPDAHKWCLEKKLAMIGASDIHEPDTNRRTTPDDHRTVTLVFAKERTLDGIKEALKARRTVVWCKDQLVGTKDWLEPVFRSSVQLVPPYQRSPGIIFVKVRNVSDVDVHLDRIGEVGPFTMTLPGRTTNLLMVCVDDVSKPVTLKYTATNFLVGPNCGLPVTFAIPTP